MEIKNKVDFKNNNSVIWLKKIIGYEFKNSDLFKLAFHHSSLYQVSKDKNNQNTQNNERLEFLGDSILGLIVSQKLYQTFSNKTEAEFTQMRSKLVNNNHLAEIAKQINLGKYIQVGQSLSVQNKNKKIQSSILANTLEALIGAIFLDTKSFKKTSNLIFPLFKPVFNQFKQENQIKLKDAKSLLQEYCQANNLPLPSYSLISEKNKKFEIVCRVQIKFGESIETKGKHSQKKIAEQIAAEKALDSR